MKWIRRFGNRISTKLLIGFATVLALLLGLSFYSFIAIGRLGASLDTAVNVDARKLRLVGQIRTGFEEMRAESTKVEMSLLNMLVGRLNGGKPGVAGSDCSSCHTQENVNAQKARFNEAGARLRRSLTEMRQLQTNDSEKASLDVVERKVDEWFQLYQEYLHLAADRDFDPAHEIMLGKIYPLIASLDKVAEQLVARQQDLLSEASGEARRRVDSSRTWAILLVLVSLATGGRVYWMVRGVSRTLRKFAAELEVVTEQVASAATKVSATSQALSEGAAQQSASLGQTSVSSGAISSMARKSADCSAMAAGKMDEATKRVADANESLQHMVGSMDGISTSSGKISRIIKVIDEIAFQTNILALNAAVEAARAGEAGLGFAVVAGAVRNLAQRSADAARDTASLIEESIAMSLEGRSKFTKVKDAIGCIADSSSQAKALVDSINESCREQTHGVAQVAQAILQMTKVTGANAGSAQQNASAGRELNTQSAALKHIVDRLVDVV